MSGSKSGNEPLVSILTPAYNHEKYVSVFLDSVLAQTYRNFELIIVDDCSTDKTPSIIEQYKDERIRFFRNDFNRGMNGNLNMAFSKAKGKYIALTASDDFIEPQYLEKMVAYFEQHKDFAVVYPKIQKVDEDGNLIPKQQDYKISGERFQMLKSFFYYGNGLSSPGMMLNRKYAETVFPLDEGIQQHQDFIIHIQLLLQADCGFLDTPLVNYRIPTEDNNHLSSNNKKAFKRIEIETPFALDYFVKGITSVSLLQKIFGTDIDAFGEPTEKTIPYFLARLALSKPENRLLTLWGFRTLIAFINQKGNMELLHSLYDFDYKTFSKLSEQVHLLDYYLEKQEQEFVQSTSWKITKPLRKLKELL
ncbi:MAG: glycosyltransferase family 2 protein [Spirochaetaceae bacterium]|nr:glycosyltransferase family 2 protein [Spirochaetaceae bacterium]